MATIALKGFGGLLFIFSSSVGAYLLVRIFVSPFVLSLCFLASFFFTYGNTAFIFIFNYTTCGASLDLHELCRMRCSFFVLFFQELCIITLSDFLLLSAYMM